MKKETHYRIVYSIMRPLGWIFLPQRNIGRENIPEGPAIICADHSNAADPVLISFALGIRHYVHHLSKIEARSIPIWGKVMENVGSIFIRRGEKDIDALKACMRALKAGEKIMQFPEGTRVHGDAVVEPKSGAIHLAAKLHVPIVPMYLPRDKKVFRRFDVVIGKPYYVQVQCHEDYDRLAHELMDKIWALKGQTHG